MPPRPISSSTIHGPSRMPIMLVPESKGKRERFCPSAYRPWAPCGSYNQEVAHKGRYNVPRTALLLIAHGSRQPDANADLHFVAAGLRQRGHAVVVASFLELAEPDIL